MIITPRQLYSYYDPRPCMPPEELVVDHDSRMMHASPFLFLHVQALSLRELLFPAVCFAARLVRRPQLGVGRPVSTCVRCFARGMTSIRRL